MPHPIRYPVLCRLPTTSRRWAVPSGRASTRRSAPGFSLIELLCSIAIIALLAGLFLGPASRALRRARALKSAQEAPAHIERLTDGMRRFAGSRGAYECTDLRTLLSQAQPGGPTERWLHSVVLEFTPFNERTPDERAVLLLELPSSRPDHAVRYLVTKGELTKVPE